MYVRVRKKGNQWFRKDNGTLVGTEISRTTSFYKIVSKHIGKRILIKDNNNEIRTIYYGYFCNNKFTKLDVSKRYLDKACDYYAFVLD